MEALPENLVRPSQKFAPYTKTERQKRRLEVFRLHIEQGYSATRISELLQVNRNTINSDLKWCYKQIDQINIEPDTILNRQLVRLELQRARLCDELKQAANFQEKIILEKLIFEIDSKVALLMAKIQRYRVEALRSAAIEVNSYLDENKLDNMPRFGLSYDLIHTSPKTMDKIRKLIKNDKALK